MSENTNKGKQVQKRDILPDTPMPVKKGSKNEAGEEIKPLDPKKYDAAGEIQKFGLKPTEVIEYTDPFSGTMKKIMIDRRGTTDEKLALTLLDPKISRELKDSTISMYLFEAGKHGASMLMDLWGYKGQHTKESRAFQSMMRYDFEMFLSVFQMFMQDSADMIFNNLPIEIVEGEVEIDGKKVKKEIVKVTRDVTANEIAVALGEYARYHRLTSSLLNKRIRDETEKRERAKGKGIYLSKEGKPYSIHEDGDIVEVVKSDKEEADKERDHE